MTYGPEVARKKLRSALEAKKTSLELKKKKKIRKSNIRLIFTGLFIIIIASNILYFKIISLQNIIYPLFPIIIPLSMIFILMRYLNEEDQVFLKIMESIELLDKGQTDPEIRNHVAEKMEEATNGLENFIEKRKEHPLWHSKVEKVEKEFIRKLRYRAIPNLRGSIPSPVIAPLTVAVIEQIALVFIESDIGQMEIVNKILAKYEERIIPSKKGYRETITNFADMKIGKAVISILAGFGIALSFTWIGSNISVKFAQQVSENLILIFASSIALSVGFMAMLSTKS